MMRTSSRAFTLIELLVVISIVSLLTGMIIAMIGPIRRNAKIAVTKVRMQNVMDGLSSRGQNEGSITYALQMATERWTGTPSDPEPGLGGVLTFASQHPTTGVSDGLPYVATGAWGKRSYYHFAYPWGKMYPDKRNPPQAKDLIGPEKIRLRDISPFNTRKLLMVADIIKRNTTDMSKKAFDEYQTDRSEKQAWNDKWGHPLVVGSALYQPTFDVVGGTEPAHSADQSIPSKEGTEVPKDPFTARDMVAEAKKRYNYNRAVYFAVAAVGTSARIDTMGDPVNGVLFSANEAQWANSAVPPTSAATIVKDGNLWKLWRQVNEVCQQAKEKAYDQDWNEKSFDVPPWPGIKLGHKDKSAHARDMNFFGTPPAPADSTYPAYAGSDEYSLLSAPMEKQ